MFVIGDSHSEFMFPNLNRKDKISKNIGARTAFKLTDHDDLVRAALVEYDPEKKNRILFVFGEIDCRGPIINKAQGVNGIPFIHLINDTAKSYLTYVHQLRQEGYNIAVLSVEPSTADDGLGDIMGKWIDRILVTEALNCAYERYCKHFNIPFFNIYSELVTLDGHRLPELIDDPRHLNGKAGEIFLQKKFEW